MTSNGDDDTYEGRSRGGVEPRLIGLVVAALARLGQASRLDEIVHAAATLDPTIEQRAGIGESLEWLEHASLVEQLGPDEWRLVGEVSEAFFPRGGDRVLPEGHLAEILAWARETDGAEGLIDALAAAAQAQPALPQAVRASMTALSRFEAPPEARRRYSLAAAFEALEEAWPEDFAVYKARQLVPGKTPTLQELGDRDGVSRERIRQRERSFETLIEGEMRGNSDWPIRVATERIRARLGPVAPADEIAEVSQLVDPEGSALTGHPHRLTLLLRLAGDYRVSGSWVVSPEIAIDTVAVLNGLTDDGPARLEAACMEVGALGVRENLQVPWIEGQEGFRVLGDAVVPWGRSMADKAASVLAIVGEPLELDDIFERIEEDKNFRGFKAQIQGDARFRRRSMKLYGLAEWGGEEYTTIVEEMTEELERQGGSMDLEELASTLATNFGVAESSVRMYAGGPQFEVDATGRVRRLSGELPVPPSSPLSMTRRCFRLPAGWAFRRTVDHDVLRGSGGGLPTAFAKEIGLRPELSLQLESPHGPIAFSWPSHMAHIGSLRSVAEALEAEEGDLLFVVACGNARLDMTLVTRSDCEAASDADRLALECGRSPGPNALDEVAAALDLDHSQPGVVTAIRLRFHERGERELASLVPKEMAADDVLDVLASLGE